jgi:hypothetical protein
MRTSLTKIAKVLLLASSVIGLGAAEVPVVKPWIVMLDWQNESKQDVSHSSVAGSYGRSRSGIEAIYKTEDGVIDLEYYNYTNNFSGALASSDRQFGKTSDLMITGFKQWNWNEKYAVQLIYALESAKEDSLSLSDGFRWGLGGAARWRPEAETDLSIGVLLEDRFENSLLLIPYIKLIWSPCRYAEVELRVNGLQNGLIVRNFLTENKSTTLDFTFAYETLSFQLADVGYGSRAVAVGEAVARIGITQFLESSGTWFVRGAVEWTPFSRYTYNHNSETQAVFQTASRVGLAARVGARF